MCICIIYINTYDYIDNACIKCDVGPCAALAERKRTVSCHVLHCNIMQCTVTQCAVMH